VNNALAETLREPIKLAHCGQILCESRREELRVGTPQIVAIENRVRPHSSRQEAPAQRPISQHRDFIFLAVG